MAEEFSAGPVFPSLPKTTRGISTVIGLAKDGKQILYCNGNSVYTVPITDRKSADIYTQHPVPTTVAKMSPSGYYVASGDNNGNVRIWDTTQAEHILKATYQVFSGPVRDIAWNDDSKRIAAVGEGRERFGHVFLFDTGTSNGNLSGQSRPISSVDFKPTRPYRLITGSEDYTVGFFDGPPFKFKTTFQLHSRFVNVTKYNKDGSLFASGGADGKVILFEGAEGEKVGELEDAASKGNAHGGSVFGLAWSPDGSKIATASGDKTVKIWNASDRALIHTVTIGNNIVDQQLGITWSSDFVVSVSLNGFINLINPELGKIDSVRQGHNKPIVTLAVSADKKNLFTSDFEGNIVNWNIATGEGRRLNPALHTAQVVGLAYANGSLYSVAWDDTLKVTPIGGTSDELVVDGVSSTVTKLSSQPLGLAVSEDGSIAVVASCKHIVLFKDGKQVSEIPVNFSPTTAAIVSTKDAFAVGGQDSKVHIFNISGNAFNEVNVVSVTEPVTSLAYSPDGKHLAVTLSSRKVIPFSVADGFKSASKKEWTFHTARVTSVAWSPDSRRLATGSLDTNVIVWDLQKSDEHPIIIRGAHTMATINGIAWLDDKTVVTAGQDANVKQWIVPF